MLRPFAHLVTCCWMLLRVVARSLKPVKLFSQQLLTFPLFREHRSVAQQWWIRLDSSSNIVGATHAHSAWFTKTYGLYPSHDALQVPTLLGVVASVCTPLPTRMQQLPTLLAQQCWELLRPFARSLRIDLFFTFYHSVFFMIIANITILIFFFMIKNIGTVIIIQLTKASMFLTITDVFSIAHLKVFQTPCFNDNVSILLLWMSIPFIGHCLDNE